MKLFLHGIRLVTATQRKDRVGGLCQQHWVRQMAEGCFGKKVGSCFLKSLTTSQAPSLSPFLCNASHFHHLLPLQYPSKKGRAHAKLFLPYEECSEISPQCKKPGSIARMGRILPQGLGKCLNRWVNQTGSGLSRGRKDFSDIKPTGTYLGSGDKMGMSDIYETLSWIPDFCLQGQKDQFLWKFSH